MGRCLRVLLVDDDSTCLVIVGAMLRKLHFQVETAKSPRDAMGTLRAKGGGFEFDVVISDVHMPDINGFQLQMMISNQFNNLLPVVLMSGDNDEGVVRQGMQNGAISFIEKPVSANALTCLWRFLTSQGKGVETRCSTMKVPVETISAPPAAAVSCPRGQGQAAGSGRSGGGSESRVAIKKKMVWTDELHFKFLDAINTLGIENAVPKNILKAMNVKGLTRENVASHLQKYRQFLRRNIQEFQNGFLPHSNSGAGYQPRFAPRRVSRFAKLQQLFFTHAQLEAAVSPSPSPGNPPGAAAPLPPLSEQDESLFYRCWTRDPIAGNADIYPYPSSETFFLNGSGEYEPSASCFGNFNVVPGPAEQTGQTVGAAGYYYDNVLPGNDDLLTGGLNFIGEAEDGDVGEGYGSTCSYSTPPQYSVPQLLGESDMMQVPPQQDFPMDFPAALGDWGENYGAYAAAAAYNPMCELSMLTNMAAADNSGGYPFNPYHPNNDQEQATMEGVGYESRQLVQPSQPNASHQPYNARDNEDGDLLQSIFGANPYGVGAPNARGV